MKKLLLLGVWLTSASLVCAQDKLAAPGKVLPPPAPASAPAVSYAPNGAWSDKPACDAPHFYLSGDYLIWWLRPNKVDVPLITSIRQPEDLAATLEAGGIADPNAFVLFGNGSKLDPGAYHGYRATIGFAFGEDNRCAIELSGLYLPEQSESFRAASNAAGQPALVLAFRDVFLNPAGTETGGVFAGPFAGGVLTGAVNITSKTQLWGGEVNGVATLAREHSFQFDLLGGFRFLRLNDELDIDAI